MGSLKFCAQYRQYYKPECTENCCNRKQKSCMQPHAWSSITGYLQRLLRMHLKDIVCLWPAPHPSLHMQHMLGKWYGHEKKSMAVVPSEGIKGKQLFAVLSPWKGLTSHACNHVPVPTAEFTDLEHGLGFDTCLPVALVLLENCWRVTRILRHKQTLCHSE